MSSDQGHDVVDVLPVLVKLPKYRIALDSLRRLHCELRYKYTCNTTESKQSILLLPHLQAEKNNTHELESNYTRRNRISLINVLDGINDEIQPVGRVSL